MNLNAPHDEALLVEMHLHRVRRTLPNAEIDVVPLPPRVSGAIPFLADGEAVGQSQLALVLGQPPRELACLG